MHTNRERAAALLRAERRVQEREKWLEGEQQELEQTRDRVGALPCHLSRSPVLSLSYLQVIVVITGQSWLLPVV